MSSMNLSSYSSWLSVLGDPMSKDDAKLKATQEMTENFETLIQLPEFQTNYVESSLKIFLKVVNETEPQFISDYNIHQLRKLILELIHRLPVSDIVSAYVNQILVLALKLLRTDNEENVLICLRIIIDLHKQYRPAFHPEIHHFISYVWTIYDDLPKHLNSIFEPRADIRVKDLKDVNIEQLLPEIFTTTLIHVFKMGPDGKPTTTHFNLLPKGVNSLKVLQELPIIVLLMYQIYKQGVNQKVVEFVPLIMSTINLQPSPVHRALPNFNNEIFVDFMGAQIKALSILAYIIRTFSGQFSDIIASYAPTMVEGMLSLLQLCPKEVAHLRKELLVATRHILATDLRNKFIPSMDLLFNEDLLLGRGYTTHESLRPLAYSTLADLVHHVRQELNLDILAKAVHLFSKNVHDESLPTSIQTMSCKLLLNLVDCIRIQRNDPETSGTTISPRELLITMLKVFTLKFHTIAKLQLPIIMQKWKNLNNQHTHGSDGHKEVVGIDISSDTLSKLTSIGFSPPNTLNITEYRNLVKTLICGVKTITYGINLTENHPHKPQPMVVTFQPSEILVFMDLFYWALEAFDIYMINVPLPGGPNAQKPVAQMSRSNDEKELLEHFSGLFLTMSNQNFQEIFSSTIHFMVDRIAQNPALQVIVNTFLSAPTTSPLFATVLIEYLLERMEEMGSNVERSDLYLRLFKLVFGSVSLFANENEQMIRPHLQKIVIRSMKLAMTAKEPYNYFLLLRALFRSIGGGSHDTLYQEFLPLLPKLLEGLNRLQSGSHKQHMKDLFVELCLTVPVRLSSLLPYLPMLMDPLVSALNGSPTLVNQGLRTLELCVDNLQPDFLYDHIQPVRADLMQALWRTLRNTDSAALVAFRVLGKFGGGNRNMMIEPQRLEYNSKESPPTAVIAYFQNKSINFPIEKAVKSACIALGSSTTDPFYWAQSWDVIRCFLAASLTLNDDKYTLQKLFMHPSFVEGHITTINIPQCISQDNQARDVLLKALTAMFVATTIADIKEKVYPIMVAVVRHYTMVSIAQQAGPFPLKHYQSNNNLDPFVLIDALASIMGHEEKDLSQAGNFAMILILKTATHIMGNKERACRLPMMQYLAEKMAALCYERPWYAKMGGCIALKFLYEHMSVRWFFQHFFMFLKSYLFVIMDMSDDVCSGAVEMAKSHLENMLTISVTHYSGDLNMSTIGNDNDELTTIQKRATFDVIHELVRRVTCPHTMVRETAMESLRLFAKLRKVTVTEVMEPHRDVLVDMIPPRKHLLRHQPASAQIGLMDATTFCTTLEPRLFTIDINIITHKVFFHEVITLSEAEDHSLSKLDCYKNVTNLIPLRKSAIRALTACHYISHNERRSVCEKIYSILYKGLGKNSELQETAFECMQKFNLECTANKGFLLQNLRPLLGTLGDYRNLTINSVKRLSYLTQLFPSMFNEKLCDQLLEIIRILIQNSIVANNGHNFLKVAKCGDSEIKIATIIEIFHQIPAATPKFVTSLCDLVLSAEKSLMIEPSCPYRAPLIKFLLRYPEETVELFLNDTNIKEEQYNRFIIYLLKHKDGAPFKNVMEQKSNRLIELILKTPNNNFQGQFQLTHDEEYESQHQSILIVNTLISLNNQWLATQHGIVSAMKTIWTNDLYKSCDQNVVCDLWHLVAKVLLNYFEHNPNDIDLLFQLLRALCLRFIPDFQFLRDFLQNTVCQNYTVEWKRNAFFLFVENYGNPNVPQELKVKILTMVVIPSFAVSYEKGEDNILVGAPPLPYQEDENNIVSIFINKVIDPNKSSIDDDALRIALLQFACLLVERSSAHIHDGDSNNKKEGNKLRRLMTFAWPCLLAKNFVDPSARYHGHLLLSHIIARLAIHKRIVLQVFHSLLKAHAVEARNVVRQALEVLTPAMPLRMEDGYKMLIHWTKKIILEEGHSMPQLYHVLQLIVRHYKVYYRVRHQLVQQMIPSMHRLGTSVSVDYRKLAIELAEVIINWELQRIKEENEIELIPDDIKSEGGKRSIALEDEARKRQAVGDNDPQPGGSLQVDIMAPSKAIVAESAKPIEKAHCESVLNFLFDLACQLVDSPTQATGTISPGEALSRHCVTLLKKVLRDEVWVHTCNLKLQRLEKVFVESSRASIGNICTGLELLTYLLGEIKKDQVLPIIRPLQRGLSICVTSTNTRIIKLMCSFLTRLVVIFPADPSVKHIDLDDLYSTISKTISEGLVQFEKNPKANPSSLFGTLLILKAACTNNHSYIDSYVEQFIHIMDRFKKEHLGLISVGDSQSTSSGEISLNGNSLTLELLLLSFYLVKNRVEIMGLETRRKFMGIIVELIEKSTEPKVISAIIKLIEHWIKTRKDFAGPSLREISMLLVKLTHYVETRFAYDQGLTVEFLELVNFIYRDEELNGTELSSKLEAAFLAGLRCSQPNIRSKFFEIFDGSVRKRLHDRILYIISTKAWDSIGQHYWIKQCIELLLLTSNSHLKIKNSNESHLVPSITSVINSADVEERKTFMTYSASQHAEFDLKTSNNSFNELDFNAHSNFLKQIKSEELVQDRSETVLHLIDSQYAFLEANRQVQTKHMLEGVSQLCHMDAQLAESVWLNIFPKLWFNFTEYEQESLSQEFIPFLSAGTKINTKDSNPTALNTFIEGISLCSPPIFIPPKLMISLGKAHNLWHRMTMLAEDMAIEWTKDVIQNNEIESDKEDDDDDDQLSTIVESLSQMYSAMQEEDLWAGMWQKYAKYPETNTAIAYEQMGYFEEAQSVYEAAMFKIKQVISNGTIMIDMNSEIHLWENHWIRCAKELNEWDILLNYGQTNKEKHAFLIMDSAWRVPDWDLMKEALLRVEQTCPKKMGHKISLYRGYLAILNQRDTQQLPSVDRYVEMASASCLQEWRRLPVVVSHIHIPILQSAQQIMELQEASQIHQGLQRVKTLPFHDMKGVVKTWCNRLPVVADDLSYWSDIFTWRQHHYQIITSHMEKPAENSTPPHSNMLGPHASAQTIIQFGKIARKHNLTGVCQQSLSRIYTIPSVPVVDCFQKIIQQVKCFLQKASVGDSQAELGEALKVIDSTNLEYFSNEMKAEFFALKGNLLTYMGKSDEANASFTSGVEMHDRSIKAWALWGDYLERIFVKDPQQTSIGVSAMTCFMHACRHQNESKSRKYLAKVIWILSYDDSRQELMETLDKYSVSVPPLQWLPWIPQLLCCLIQYEGDIIMNLLSQVARIFPQGVYFPIRTLYLMLKIEQRERHKSVELAVAKNQHSGSDSATSPEFNPQAAGSSSQQPGTSAQAIKATPPMWRCSKIMHRQRDIHPTVLNSLEGIVDQMVWFRENWYEEVLRQLRQGLTKCYAIAFENRGTVNEATITPHTLNFVKKLVSTFGIGIENLSNSATSANFASAASESLARRALATVQDPVFQKLKEQFTSDFDFSKPDSIKLHNLIAKLKVWIKTLELKTKQLPKSFLIEEKCRFLSNFSQKTAEVDLPGELLLPHHSYYHIRIARFMPRVEIVQKHNTAARRLFIRGTNGKIYPYLAVNDFSLGDTRREERILQLLRMLNTYLSKQKETSKRLLHITVPRVVAVSPQMRLVEDDPSSISLLDIYKKSCTKFNIEHDAPIARYYERLAEVQSRGSQTTHIILRDVFKEIQSTMIPKTILKDWASKTFNTATDYWTFRKMFTLQLSLSCIIEYAFHLTRLNADMMYLHQDSGLVNVSYFKFDVDDVTGELNTARPIPFRLTPNIVEFLTETGIVGPLQASVIATARCFLQPNFQLSIILRTILRDEIVAIHRRQIMDNKPIDLNQDLSQDKSFSEINTENVIQVVNRAVQGIIERLNSLAFFDQNEATKISTLVKSASSEENLCRMDPNWHPWL